MKLLTFVLAASWLMASCIANPPNEDSTGAGNRDARTGLCNDATPPPCNPPKD
jgi:hypothetical protein